MFPKGNGVLTYNVSTLYEGKNANNFGLNRKRGLSAMAKKRKPSSKVAKQNKKGQENKEIR